MKPHRMVDPNLDIDFSHVDVDAEHAYLIPRMEIMEQGEQVCLNDVPAHDLIWLGRYYYSKQSEARPHIRAVFHEDVKIEDGKHVWYGHLNLPHVPDYDVQAKRKKFEQRKRGFKFIAFIHYLFKFYFGH